MTGPGGRPLLFLDVYGPLVPFGVPAWEGWQRVHWKTLALVARASGRPFVWVDDEIRDADRGWVARHHPGQALLHRVDPRTGLGDGDFAAINRWLERERSLSQE